MKTIQKTAKFGWNIEQKFYCEKFDSYNEFYETLMKRQTIADKTLEYILNDNAYNWTGVNSVQEATDLLLKGWSQNVERMKVAFNHSMNVINFERKIKVKPNVSGFMPIVPNAIRGLPNSMLDLTSATKKSKILNFMIAIDRASSNSVESIIEKMSRMFAYIASIERSGQYRCRLSVFFTACGDGPNRQTKTAVCITIKSENQLFDIKRTCFPIIHPAMLRLFCFGWEESLPIKEEHHEGGYGTAFEHWCSTAKQQLIDVINQGNEKTICLDLKSDIEEELEKGGII